MGHAGEIFQAKQGDRLLKLTFKEPLFALFADFPALCREVYPRLQPFGLQTNGLSLKSAGGDLGEIHLHCEIPGSATARVWIDRLEVWSDLFRLSQARHADFTAHLLDGLASHQPSLQGFDADLRVHGSLDTRTSNEFLETWGGQVPENLGPHLGSGVVFYFGPYAGRSISSVTLDNSALVQGGLFIRTRAVGDAAALGGRELGDIADAYFLSALHEVGLTTEEEHP